MRIHSVPCSVVALVLLVSSAATATPANDGLATLHTRLSAYVADAPIAATLRISETSTNNDGGKARTRSGHITMQLRSDKSGVTVKVPKAEFDRADDETKPGIKDLDATTSSSGLLGAFSLSTARAMLDFAPALQRMLATSELTAHESVTRNGKPAQLLVFDVPMTASAKKDDDLKDFSSILKVWLGTDGSPLAITQESHSKYRKFLINFSTYSQRSWELAVIGTRLICTKRHEESGGAGMGQSGKSVTETVLGEVHDAPASDTL